MNEALIALLVLIALSLLGQFLLSREGTTIAVASWGPFSVKPGDYVVVGGRARKILRMTPTTITVDV